MPLTKINIAPGIFKDDTVYSQEGKYIDAEKIRFMKGRPDKIGGWAKNTLNTFQATGRALHAWVDLELTKYLGLGTTWNFYI